MLTDVGALEFRILATHKHTSDADVKRALGPTGRSKPPPRYMWARLGEVSTGTNPDHHRHDDHRPRPGLEEEPLRGDQRRADRQGRLGDRADGRGADRPEHHRHARPRAAARPEQDHVVPGRVQPERDRRGVDPKNPRPNDPIIREDKVAPGRVERSILCNIDREDVTGKYLPADLRHPGRAAPAGRRLRLQPPGGAEVRQADPRAPSRGGGRLQVSTRDPARQPGDVGAVDQLRDPRPGDHRGGRPGLQGQGGRLPDQDPPGREPAGQPESRTRSRRRRSARPWARTPSPRASAPSGSRCWSCRSSWSSTTGSPGSSRSSP